VENKLILLHVGELLEPINSRWQFQKKKVRSLPKSYKNLGNIKNLKNPENVMTFLEFFLKLPLTMLLGTFF
jgi:hypothetical protein